MNPAENGKSQDALLAELYELAGNQCDGELTSRQAERLEALVMSDRELRRHYIIYMQIHAVAEKGHWKNGRLDPDNDQQQGADRSDRARNRHSADAPFPDLDFDASFPESPPFPLVAASQPVSIVVTDSSPHGDAILPSTLFGYFSQIGPFSYLVSALLMCIAVLAAWRYEITEHTEITRDCRSGRAAPQLSGPVRIGRISGMGGCQWAEDRQTDEQLRSSRHSTPSLAPGVSVGRTFNLDAGLLEIAYDSGATVILQGPAKFAVDSNGGFLAVGRLTGKLEKKPGDPNPRSPIPNPFVIRTPTAIVTDLGTEFGVEVDKEGHTASHVFRGAVRLHPIAVANARQDLVLKENEAARVEIVANHAPSVQRTQLDSSLFPHAIANRRVPIHVFNTGAGVNPRANNRGKIDRRWEILPSNGDPGFEPLSAIVFPRDPRWIENDPGRSEWISSYPHRFQIGVTYTFRTTFELKDVRPETAVLHGWFGVVERLLAIRMNGESLSVPDHEKSPSSLFHKFTIDHGFVEGTNVLEFDVKDTPILRMDLEGSVQEQ